MDQEGVDKVCNVNVHVRFRGDVSASTASVAMLASDKKTITMTSDKKNAQNEHAFKFDHVYDESASQCDLFDGTCRTMVEHVVEGYNACCIAYGENRSGKTHSMFGGDGESRGMAPRTLEAIFSAILSRSNPNRETRVLMSFIEIFNDQIIDLGKNYVLRDCTSTIRNPLEIHEDAGGSVYVKDLTVVPVKTVAEALCVVKTGRTQHEMSERRTNFGSGKSHSILTISLVHTDTRSNETLSGRVQFVDLAGSDNDRSNILNRQQSIAISRSLSALSKVLVTLNTGVIRNIPFRDSKLTRLLQNSLGGNCYTTLFANVISSPEHREETLNTLMFASQCANINNRVSLNCVEVNPSSQAKLIEELTEEIRVLQEQLLHADMESGVSNSSALMTQRSQCGSRSPKQVPMYSFKGDRDPSVPSLANHILFQNRLRAPSISDKAESDTGESTARLQIRLRETENKIEKYKKKLEQALDAMQKMRKQQGLDSSEALEIREKLGADLRQAREQLILKDEENRRMKRDVFLQKEKQLRQLAEANNKKLDASRLMIRDAAASSLKSETGSFHEEALERVIEKRIQEAVVKLRRQWHKAKKEEIDQLQAEKKFYLSENAKSLERMQHEHEQCSKEYKEELAQMSSEMQLMTNTISKLSLIIERIESGEYSICEKSGIRRLCISLKDANLLERREERSRILLKGIGQANNFISKQNRLQNHNATSTKSLLSDISKYSSGSSLDGGGLRALHTQHILNGSASNSDVGLRKSRTVKSSQRPATAAHGERKPRRMAEERPESALPFGESRDSNVESQEPKDQRLDQLRNIFDETSGDAEASYEAMMNYVMQELEGESTMQYFLSIQKEKDYYKNRCTRADASLRDLRVAHQAQLRIIHSLRATSNKPQLRPSKSSSGRGLAKVIPGVTRPTTAPSF